MNIMPYEEDLKLATETAVASRKNAGLSHVHVGCKPRDYVHILIGQCTRHAAK